MTPRFALAALCAMGLVAPAAAQDGGRSQSRAAEIGKTLADPGAQIAVTAALAGLMEAVLDLKVGPLARAAGNASGDPELRDMPPDASLRDVAGPGGDRLQQKIARETPRMMASMAGMAGALDEMMPQLRAMARRMRDAIPPQ
ncbi:MAG: hypothetical protein M0R03_06250 [Novosphingobium sp.]|nr:hypothetical protein [Novosphingobium sp.]